MISRIVVVFLCFVWFCASSPCNITSFVEFLQVPFVSIENGKERMGCIKDYFLQNNDKRAFFSSLYIQVTVGVEQAIANNVFHDGAWIGYYDYQFANFYREALLHWEQGQKTKVPLAWAQAFESATNNSVLILQHLLLGINAHIDNDLAQVIALLNITVDTPSKHNDSLLINNVIVSVYKSMVPGFVALYAPVVDLNPLVPALYAIMADLESSLREDAWNFAFKLINATTLQHAVLVEQLNLSSDVYANEILALPWIDSSLALKMRQLEGDQLKIFCTLVSWAC